MTKVLIAMSGGVDSSVAACLMKEKGFDCMGVTMKLYDNSDAGISCSRSCCSIDDIDDARTVCMKMDIPYHVFNFEDDFREKVIDKFIASYEQGITPNPCIDCNRYLKFQRLYDRGKVLGCDYIVTGHYARIKEEAGRFLLLKGQDPKKDQIYVLYMMTQDQLAHTKFPLGDIEKSEAREIAEKHGFINAAKPDSQDICFVPDGDYAAAIERLAGKTYPEGDFVDQEGNVLGTHKGIIRYTLGQRKGLGLALKEPAYVVKKDVDSNRVILGRNEDLFTSEFDVADVNWIKWEVPPETFRAKVKVRYNQKEQWATVYPGAAPEDTANTGKQEHSTECTRSKAHSTAHVVFDEPQRAITPGQAAVFYDEDYVVGGGTIV